MRLASALLLAALAVGAGPRSGYDTMAPALQAMQRDDSANPGMLWVAEGEAAWQAQGCGNCHGLAQMQGVAARYPAMDGPTGRPLDLTGRIAQCREQRLSLPALPREAAPMLALTAFVAQQSRGMPVAPDDNPGMAAWRAAGEAAFRARRGQLNLSCAQCHDQHAGGLLGGSRIPEGHANGYPLYRLEWQELGSLRRRIRNCLTGVRAAPMAEEEMLALESYLAQRGRGLPVEAPAIRP